MKEELARLALRYLDPLILFVRRNLKEYVPTVDNNLVHSCFNMMNAYIQAFSVPPAIAGAPAISPERLAVIKECNTPLFLVSLVWSVGASCNEASREEFDAKFREMLLSHGDNEMFPQEDSVYDWTYKFNPDPEAEQAAVWMKWEETQPKFALKQKLPYFDVIVPTVDSIRQAAVMNHLAVKLNNIAAVGPTGTGKSIFVTDMIMNRLPERFQGLIFTFSAQTSANVLQDSLMSKLDKRRKDVYGAPTGKHFVCFIDDTNLPQKERYGAQPPLELLRQFLGHGGFYTYHGSIKFQHIIDVSLALAMGPPGGGRNPLSNRFLRFFNFIAFPELSVNSMSTIFGAILQAGFSLGKFAQDVSECTYPLIESTLSVFQKCQKVFVPTPAHVHYTFNLRDVSRVFAMIYESDSKFVTHKDVLCRLWVHEMERVFGDRLINQEDHDIFNDFINSELIERLDYEKGRAGLITAPRLVFGDYMVPGSDRRNYEEVTDIDLLVTRMNEYLTLYNEEDDHMEMNLVLFLDAIEHVSRISRVLRMPGGHCLLLGIGGSGRKSLTRLACSMSDRMELFTVEITKNFGEKEWRESISEMLLGCGKDDKRITFLYNDTQITKPIFLEEVASLLTSGDIPNIFDEKQIELINDQFRNVCLSEGLPTTKISMYSRFVKEVRNNLHVVLAFSPIGEIFRTRMRMFPALVNCCTIDWFAEWPKEALFSVATSDMENAEGEGFTEEQTNKIADAFTEIHLSAAQTTEQFFVETKRRSYVTPTSYLSLLQTFQSILVEKRQFVVSQRVRLTNGLDKLRESEDRVAELEDALKAKAPILVQTQEEIKEMMAKLAVDKEIAAEKQAEAQKEEKEASKKADECSRMQKQCADRLAEAEPALKEAVKVLKTIKAKDIGELGNYRNPPAGVKYVMEAVSVMLEFGECPKDCIVGPPGQKEANWWLVAKQKLRDPKAMLETLTESFDKERMGDSLMDKIKPYIENPDFVPQKVKEVSLPCMAMCAWVHAMHTWFYVNKEVIPLRAELAKAEAELAVVTAALNETRAKLAEVEANVRQLQNQYDNAIARQKELQGEIDLTQQKLNRAARLIDGLGGEKQRWKDLLTKYSADSENVVGDALLAAGGVAYFGPLTMQYRKDLTTHWATVVAKAGVTHSEHVDLTSIVGNPVEIQQWQLYGLPSDSLSTENALVMYKSSHWPLMIDPQGQANAWLRNMYKEELTVCRLSDPNYVKIIEVAVRMGKPCLLENVGEHLEPILDAVLLKAVYNIGSTPHLRIGDSVIPYDANFRFFMTSKLPNPVYTPEAIVKVSLLNFFITPLGLEDQLLAKTVELERQDLEEEKKKLTRDNAEKNKELKELQDQILVMMQEAEGDILEQEVLISTLEMSKKKSNEINDDLKRAKETEKTIDEIRNKYRPHAFRGSLLFFAVAAIANIDPMYQFSLQWFMNLFVNGIDKAEKDEDLEVRINNLKDYFTYSFYCNVCRSLFERHKLMFSFFMCTSIISAEGDLDDLEFRTFLTGVTSVIEDGRPNPASDWLTEQSWDEIQFVSNHLPSMKGFDEHVAGNVEHYKQLFDSIDAHEYPLAGEWQEKATPLQKLLVTRAFRLDKVTHGIQDFVKHYIGERYIIVPQFNLLDAYRDSDCTSPLIFIISPGSDPMSDLLKFAEQMRMSKKLDKVSLGQGQGPKATELVRDGVERGTWVLLQNCHLATSWMPELEQIVEGFTPESVKKEFRLWLTSMPAASFPVSVLQIGVKMTNEPPMGLRANMTRAFFGLKDDDLTHKKKPEFFKYLLFAECLFHAVIQERRRFGSLGFNIAYEFNDSDRHVCVNQLRKFLDMYEDVPFDVLKFLTGEINYGGRVTDDWDRRCLMTMIKDFLNTNVLNIDYKFSPSGTYSTIQGGNRQYYLDHLSTWPINPNPEVFGLHDNADITSARNQTNTLLQTVLSTMSSGGGSGKGKSRDEILKETATGIQEKLPKPFDMVAFSEKYPTMYEQSMNTVLVQEASRYNKLLIKMAITLKEFLRALKGEVVMSVDLETMGTSLFVNSVPELWAKVAYPSLMPLSSWVIDLLHRYEFIKTWYEEGPPIGYWMGGFFFPQAFLTGTLQNHARKIQEAIDTISFGFNILEKKPKELTERVETGAIIYGLILEGARWDPELKSIAESRPKELFVDFPPIHLQPIVNREVPANTYRCPVYKTLTRAGTLSTTGHSTNFVLAIEIPTDAPAEHWIKRGVACLLGLNF